ncbi:MAG: biotin transporter BioY [Streptosporangiales bacterium]|nr:biotin transporter BioY [Streptosporangiales bacterium]
MSNAQIAAERPLVLADALPGRLTRDVALVTGSAVFVGIAAQVAVPLPFTPVPLTMQAFAVLLAAAALGPLRGVLGMAFYLLAGVAGVPWFTDGMSGAGMPSFGYILGFVLAGAVVGGLAARGGDRSPLRTAATMTLGLLAIYAFGVPYLMVATGSGLGQALMLGVVPFLLGDALKIAAASALLPATWRLAGRR